LRKWITPDLFETLDSCASAGVFIDLIEKIVLADRGSGVHE
jgi:hypothetical protein